MTSRREEHERYLKQIFANSISSGNPSKETLERAMKESPSYFNNLKIGLMNKYKDWDLLDLKGIEQIENIYGETLRITKKEKINFSIKNRKKEIRKEFLSNLKLIQGIGEKTETKLKDNNYNNIEDLLKHKIYAEKSQKILDEYDKNCFVKEYEILKKLSKNNYNYYKDSFSNKNSNNLSNDLPNNSYNNFSYFNKYNNSKNDLNYKNKTLKALSSLDPFNLKFMDIETLGLSNVPIILIGVAEIKGKYIETNQYLLQDKENEAALIEGYLTHLDNASVHVTYNGASFDIPFIKNRANYYRINYKLDQIHYDLMYFARNLWKDSLPNCKLTTIEEEIFNIKRVDDVPGQFIPNYYETYLKENNIGPLVPIIDHNRQDIVSLAHFLMKIYEESF